MVRAFLATTLAIVLTVVLGGPERAAAQTQPPAAAASTYAPESIGSVASLQGSATVTRANTTTALRANADIFKGDVLQTSANSTMAVTLDDETTFTLNANSRMVMDDFVYQSGTVRNSGAYNVLRGSVAFIAGQVAHTGDMRISTPTATMGIRGTTGVVDVPEGAATAGQVGIKLYPDADGRVGRIEVFAPGPNGARLGTLTRAASGFGVSAGAGGRFAAVALQISPQEAARDRGFVQRMFVAHQAGRQLIQQRNTYFQQNPQLRPNRRPLPNVQPNPQRQPNLRSPQQPGQQPQQRQNLRQRQGQQPALQQPGAPTRPGQPALPTLQQPTGQPRPNLQPKPNLPRQLNLRQRGGGQQQRGQRGKGRNQNP